MKFAICLKSRLLFISFYCFFLFGNKTLRLNDFKTRTDMYAKISVFVNCVEAIILYNLHDCAFKKIANFRGNLLQNYKKLECKIFKILLKHAPAFISAFSICMNVPLSKELCKWPRRRIPRR